MNGNCQIFQTDNGSEFNNRHLKVYLENINVLYLWSAPYYPQSNGCCEAVQKEIKNFLLKKYESKKKSLILKSNYQMLLIIIIIE